MKLYEIMLTGFDEDESAIVKAESAGRAKYKFWSTNDIRYRYSYLDFCNFCKVIVVKEVPN